MPIEIKELLVKATVAIDWDKQKVTAVKEEKACIKPPSNKEIISYTSRYFKKKKVKNILLGKAGLSAFLIAWKDSWLNRPERKV